MTKGRVSEMANDELRVGDRVRYDSVPGLNRPPGEGRVVEVNARGVVAVLTDDGDEWAWDPPSARTTLHYAGPRDRNGNAIRAGDRVRSVLDTLMGTVGADGHVAWDAMRDGGGIYAGVTLGIAGLDAKQDVLSAAATKVEVRRIVQAAKEHAGVQALADWRPAPKATPRRERDTAFACGNEVAGERGRR